MIFEGVIRANKVTAVDDDLAVRVIEKTANLGNLGNLGNSDLANTYEGCRRFLSWLIHRCGKKWTKQNFPKTINKTMEIWEKCEDNYIKTIPFKRLGL